MRECGRCGDEYESYTVFVTKSFNSISLHAHIEEKFGNVCKDCREKISEDY